MHDNPQLPWYSVFWSRQRKDRWIADQAAKAAARWAAVQADMNRIFDEQVAASKRIMEDIAARASARALASPNTPRRPWTPTPPPPAPPPTPAARTPNPYTFLPPLPTQTNRTPANRPNPPATPSSYSRTRTDDLSSLGTNIAVAAAVGSMFSGGSRETVSYDSGSSSYDSGSSSVSYSD